MAVRCCVINKIQTLNITTILTSRPRFLSQTCHGFESFQATRKLFSVTVIPKRPNEPWVGKNEGLAEIGQKRGLSVRSKARRRRWQMPTVTKPLPEREKELELEVQIGIEEEIPEDDQEVLNIAEILRVDVPSAMRVALDRLKVSTSTTRDRSLDNLSAFDTAELSILLCNDNFIRKLNKEWRDKDAVTDVLSMSQHIPGLPDPTLLDKLRKEDRLSLMRYGSFWICSSFENKNVVCKLQRRNWNINVCEKGSIFMVVTIIWYDVQFAINIYKMLKVCHALRKTQSIHKKNCIHSERAGDITGSGTGKCCL